MAHARHSAAVLGTPEYPQRGVVDRWHRATGPLGPLRALPCENWVPIQDAGSKSLEQLWSMSARAHLATTASPRHPHGIDSGTRTQTAHATCNRRLRSDTSLPFARLAIYVRVSVCRWLYLYLYPYLCTSISISISMYILMYVCICCTYTNTHTHTRTHTHTHTHTRARTHAH